MVNENIKPGDVVEFKGKSEYFIYQGSLPQGEGNTILQFANDEETRGMSMGEFLKEGRLVPSEERPLVTKEGLTYVFAK